MCRQLLTRHPSPGPPHPLQTAAGRGYKRRDGIGDPSGRKIPEWPARPIAREESWQ